MNEMPLQPVNLFQTQFIHQPAKLEEERREAEEQTGPDHPLVNERNRAGLNRRDEEFSVFFGDGGTRLEDFKGTEENEENGRKSASMPSFNRRALRKDGQNIKKEGVAVNRRLARIY